VVSWGAREMWFGTGAAGGVLGGTSAAVLGFGGGFGWVRLGVTYGTRGEAWGCCWGLLLLGVRRLWLAYGAWGEACGSGRTPALHLSRSRYRRCVFPARRKAGWCTRAKGAMRCKPLARVQHGRNRKLRPEHLRLESLVVRCC